MLSDWFWQRTICMKHNENWKVKTCLATTVCISSFSQRFVQNLTSQDSLFLKSNKCCNKKKSAYNDSSRIGSGMCRFIDANRFSPCLCDSQIDQSAKWKSPMIHHLLWKCCSFRLLINPVKNGIFEVLTNPGRWLNVLTSIRKKESISHFLTIYIRIEKSQ